MSGLVKAGFPAKYAAFMSKKPDTAGFRSRPGLGWLRLQQFSTQSRLRLPVKENIILNFFKTDYKLYKIIF